jgi:hypothetical protein
MHRFIVKTMIAASLATCSLTASASPLLFVSDSNTDLSIATTLAGAGHTVTSFTGQYNAANGGTTGALLGQLSPYATVYWSATGDGGGAVNGNTAMLANLSNYVMAGGRVFVTGYDSIAHPGDPLLMAFLGGSSSVDSCGTPGVISSTANSLTTGVKDIRGALPGTAGTQSCDRDGLGGLGADTIGIVGDGHYAGHYQWTLRSLGLGQIAYVSNGNPNGNSSMWSDGSAYHSAVLNFAFNAVPVAQVPEPATFGLFGLGLAAALLARRKRSAV